MINMKTDLSLKERVYGCWLGKSIGGTIGLPAEGDVGPLNFTYYDPVPTSAPPNDDLELQLVWLHLLEQKGLALTQEDLAQAWLEHIHYMWDEYGRCRWNLRRGVPAAAVGSFENWFGAGMGSPIRSEIWACVCAGKPDAAAAYARLDASLDHSLEGIEGEVYLAVMQSLVLAGVPLRQAMEEAMSFIDSTSETAQGLAQALRLYGDCVPAWDAYAQITQLHKHDNFTHAPLNLSLIGWALAYGEGDFDSSLLLGTNCGYDTDCTAATVGATMGMLLGAEAIDERWTSPIGDGVYVGQGIQGIRAPDTLGELTERTMRMHESFVQRSHHALPVVKQAPKVDLGSLPGTVSLLPFGATEPVRWANGELPREVLGAGGAEWVWTVGAEVAAGCHLIALAREGCRLYVDDKLVVDCPSGVEFVPAVHRPATAAKVKFQPERGSYKVRLELNCKSEEQDASVLLGMLNRHLTAWDGSVMPNGARLANPS